MAARVGDWMPASDFSTMVTSGRGGGGLDPGIRFLDDGHLGTEGTHRLEGLGRIVLHADNLYGAPAPEEAPDTLGEEGVVEDDVDSALGRFPAHRELTSSRLSQKLALPPPGVYPPEGTVLERRR